MAGGDGPSGTAAADDRLDVGSVAAGGHSDDKGTVDWMFGGSTSKTTGVVLVVFEGTLVVDST
jgi:hypothetical protein